MIDKPVIDVKALINTQANAQAKAQGGAAGVPVPPGGPAVPGSPPQPQASPPDPASAPPSPAPPVAPPDAAAAVPSPLVTQRLRVERQTVRQLGDNAVVYSFDRTKNTYVQSGGAFVTDAENPLIQLADGQIVDGLDKTKHGCPFYNPQRPRKLCGLLVTACQCSVCGVKVCRSHVWRPSLFTDKAFCGRCLRVWLLTGVLRCAGRAVASVFLGVLGVFKWFVDSFKEPPRRG